MININAPHLVFEKEKIYRSTVGEKHPLEKKSVVVIYEHGDAGENEVANNPAEKVTSNFSLMASRLQPSLKEMLEKLLKACRFEIDDAAFIPVAQNDESQVQELVNLLTPRLVLIFGEQPLSRNISRMKKNEAYEINNTIYLQSIALEKLAANKTEKDALWMALKKSLRL